MKSKFIKLPKALFEDGYIDLSCGAKLLYSLLLDRKLLSEQNSMTDSNGRTIVYFTNNEVCQKLKCSHDKATKLFRELERFKLIHRLRQGKGKPDIIYVDNFIDSEEASFKSAENTLCRVQKLSVPDCGKSAGNKTEINNTDRSNTNLSIDYDEVENEIKFQIEYDVLVERDYGGVLDEMVRLMTDTYCYASDTVRINKRQIPIQSVRKRLSMVTAEHIEYVISSLEKNKSKIKNMRAYLLTTLYNSIDTMETDCLYGN